jgi:hypothetical protein
MQSSRIALVGVAAIVASAFWWTLLEVLGYGLL